MKKVLLICLLVFGYCFNGFSQIKFMGIPIDGPKNEMISKLEKKGFTSLSWVKEYEALEKQDTTIKIEQSLRYNDEGYWMEGFFDGKKCSLGIYSYYGNVYRILLAFDDAISDKFSAFLTFNYYADKLQKKYYSDKNYYNPLDYSDVIELDEKRFNFYIDEENQGGVMLMMTYPSSNLEYHILLEYINVANSPHGEDL